MQKFNSSTIQNIIDCTDTDPKLGTKSSLLLGVYIPRGATWGYEVRIELNGGRTYVTQFGQIISTGTTI